MTRSGTCVDSREVPELDLRAITRDADKAETTVSFFDEIHAEVPWIRLGAAALHQRRSRGGLLWELTAYLADGVTDPDEHSAYALWLPLIGVTFEGVHYHMTTVYGVVGHDTAFRVPPPGYDPKKIVGAEMCADCDPPHLILPEGYGAPPYDARVHARAAGRVVVVRFGLAGERGI